MAYDGNPLQGWGPKTKDNKTVMKFKDGAVPEVLEECPVLDFRLAFGKEVFGDR